LDERTYLQAVQRRLARELSSHEQRIARGCFAHEVTVEELVAMLRSRLSFISRTDRKLRFR